MTAKLNGKPVSLGTDSLHWASIRREWKAGDRLTIVLPMRLWVSRLIPKKDYPAAILYGPVVLAARAANPGFVEKLDLNHIDRQLTPAAGEALTWRLAADPAILFRPFYAYKEGERYFLYLDPAAALYVPHNAVTYRMAWNACPQFHFTNVVGATAECTFEGTGIRWNGFKFDDAGRAEVSLDGKVVAVVDQYGPGRGLSFAWSVAEAQAGQAHDSSEEFWRRTRRRRKAASSTSRDLTFFATSNRVARLACPAAMKARLGKPTVPPQPKGSSKKISTHRG